MREGRQSSGAATQEVTVGSQATKHQHPSGQVRSAEIKEHPAHHNKTSILSFRSSAHSLWDYNSKNSKLKKVSMMKVSGSNHGVERRNLY